MSRFYIYILRCSDDTYYTGCTSDIERRVRQHNQAKNGAHYTKIRRPVELIYSEQYETLALARKREAAIKKWNRERKERLWR